MLTPKSVEGLLGPSAGVLEGLLTPRFTGNDLLLYLDVLVHAAAAQGGLLTDAGGMLLTVVGLEPAAVTALLAACASTLPRCLDSAQLTYSGGRITYTSLVLPVDGGLTVALATDERSGHRIDFDAMLAVLPGITCALNNTIYQQRRAV